jgi:serine O-acetyltransferase
MLDDIRAAWRRDPALFGIQRYEVLLYPGVWTLWAHRLCHRLYRCRVPFLPRALSQAVRALTHIEIHPGATIGRRLFIDHGSAVVIGETAVIGDDVTIYHSVTLGGRGWWRDAKGSRRHPTVGDRVVIGVGATILGPVHIGHDARIGAHALVLTDIPAGAHVHAPPSTVVPPGPPEEATHAHVSQCPRTDRPHADGAVVPPGRRLAGSAAGQARVGQPGR